MVALKAWKPEVFLKEWVLPDAPAIKKPAKAAEIGRPSGLF
jgi:hypothetical protein